MLHLSRTDTHNILHRVLCAEILRLFRVAQEHTKRGHPHLFADRIYHIHFKDIKLYPEKLAECGVMAYPLDYMSPKIPGLGDVNWGAFVSALNDIRFNGCAVIEVEDKAFESCKEDILNSIRLSKRYLDNFII